jgi:aryl-alcohol dehydrogenase-like predicted oxidoreductase
MQQRRLGSGFITSAIGLGCMGFSQGFGPADDSESVAAIHRALDTGITLLDTAMSYGAGHNERLIARALAGRRGDDGHVQIATKFGIVRDGSGVRLDAHPDRVRGYCVESLRRLGVEAVDLYYLHRVDPAVPLAETVGAMAELVREGLVRHLGVSEVTPAQLTQAAAVHPIAAVQFEWSLLWREAERDLIPAARALGIGLVPYSPLGRGLLTAALDRESIAVSDYRAADPRFQGENLERNLRQVEVLRSVASGFGLSPGQFALAWLLAQGDDVVPIPGSRRADRIAENAAAAGLRLDPHALQQLDLAAPAEEWAGDRRSFAASALIRGSRALGDPCPRRSQPPHEEGGKRHFPRFGLPAP